MEKVRLNQILITKKTVDSQFALKSDLYEIESQVTNETTIQSVTTDAGNEHTVEFIPIQCFLFTNVPRGSFVLSPSPSQNKQVKLHEDFLVIGLKG